MCVRNQLPAINIILQILFENMYPRVACVSIYVAVYQTIRILLLVIVTVVGWYFYVGTNVPVIELVKMYN